MSNRRKVLDFSNFSGVPTQQQFDQLKAAGWQGVILGTQFPNITRQQYQACEANGLPVEALYVFVYWDADDTRRLNEAIQLSTELELLVWLDCEWTYTGFPARGPCPPPAQLIDLIRSYRETLGVSYAGIYTGAWWWPSYVANTQEFRTDALWHAAYQSTEPDFDTFRSYGGWLRPSIWQYSSNGDQGVNADLNIVEGPFEVEVPPAPVVPAGIGVHYRDGSTSEIWNVNNAGDKVLDGVGLRLSDGTITRIWPA